MRFGLIFLLVCVFFGQSAGQEAVIFKKNSEINLNPYLYYFLDSSGSYEIEDIRDHSHEFRLIGGEQDLRLGVDNTVAWLRLRIHNPYDRKEDAVIDFKDPSLFSLILYQINNEPLLSGTGTEQDRKNIRGNRNAFILSLSSGETRDVLIRVDSKNYMTLKATIEDDEYFFQQTGNEKIFFGFYYGILTLIFTYSTILWFISRIHYFFWYSMYILINILFSGLSDGLTPQYLFFLVNWANGYHGLILAVFSNLIGMIFLRSYFRPCEWAPTLNKIILGTIYFIGATGLLFFVFNANAGFAVMRLIGLVALGFYLGTSFYGMRRHIRGSRIFFVAFSILGIFILIYILNLYRVIEYNRFVQYSIHYGFLLSNIVLSGAMGARIYHLYQSFLLEEQDKQIIIRQKNEELEIQVQERTANLAMKERMLRSILDNSSRAIWLVDENYILKEFNTSFKYNYKAAFGFDLQRDMNFMDQYFDEAGKMEWARRYDRVFRGEIVLLIEEYEVDGEKRTYEVMGVPIRNNDKIDFAAVFSTDITDRITYEDQLKAQNFNLRKVNEELDRFVYSASHDLKAPLSSLQGLISLLKLETEDSLRENYYEMMEKSIKRLDQFIRDIIDYSRNTRVEIRRDVIDINELIRSVYQDLHYMGHAADFTLNVNIKDSAKFYGDETRLRIVFRNLLSNGLRYGYKENGEKQLDVFGRIDEKIMEIQIRDHGPGIGKEHRDNIFKMFYRAHETSDGTGLGLYIVKETVEKMGGSITLETSENGTTFLIKIPNN